MDADIRWHEVFDNVTALACWLREQRDYTAEDLCWFLKAPWRYGDEWREYQLHLAYEKEAARAS